MVAMTLDNENSESIFSVQDVSFKIGSIQILSHITIEINKHKITGIIGPSGSGKSTFLRLLNNLISPTTGKIFFNGQDIAEIPPTLLRKQIGLVQQRPYLFEGTVKENLLYGPKIWGIDYSEDDLLHLLDKVALPHEFLERDIEGLSGGEQQRVSLARSLANEPQVLLLDEPTSSLDVISEEIIESTLKRLSEERQVKVIIVTHSLEQTERLTEQLLFLKGGQLVETAPTEEFFTQYRNDEIRSFFKKKEEN
ncbi:MAG: ABC transporter ATP-binding protein [Candidatus Heimdallarchaeota archaeon]|nr:MAG: phosphate ABC transporter ATP-binding protein [Candidatus Gerdarchaeota archaeon]RLI71327.1 MAG: phosphate ABC transporter ATP-binding protein [Candidatus Gerdarchaeota archaeon]